MSLNSPVHVPTTFGTAGSSARTPDELARQISEASTTIPSWVFIAHSPEIWRLHHHSTSHRSEPVLPTSSGRAIALWRSQAVLSNAFGPTPLGRGIGPKETRQIS